MQLRDILKACVFTDGRKTYGDVACVFGVSRQTVHRWILENEIPAGVALRILQLRAGAVTIAHLGPFVSELDG